MAIFGYNGAVAGAIYLAALYALYGQKNSGFKDDAEIQKIESILARKGLAQAAKSGGRKAAVAELRKRRMVPRTIAKYSRRTPKFGQNSAVW